MFKSLFKYIITYPLLFLTHVAFAKIIVHIATRIKREYKYLFLKTSFCILINLYSFTVYTQCISVLDRQNVMEIIHHPYQWKLLSEQHNQVKNDLSIRNQGYKFDYNKIISLSKIFWEFVAADSGDLFDYTNYIKPTIQNSNSLIEVPHPDSPSTLNDKLRAIEDISFIPTKLYVLPTEIDSIMEINADVFPDQSNMPVRKDLLANYLWSLAFLTLRYIGCTEPQKYPSLTIRLIGDHNTLIDKFKWPQNKFYLNCKPIHK